MCSIQTGGGLIEIVGGVNQNVCEIQAVGAGALNQAVKAVAISRGYVAPTGKDLVMIPAFSDIQIDGNLKTAIKLIVKAVQVALCRVPLKLDQRNLERLEGYFFMKLKDEDIIEITKLVDQGLGYKRIAVKFKIQ